MAPIAGRLRFVEHIMRDVNGGWLLRYAHANGASFFFIVVYLHIFRGLFYGSYKAPREMVWLLGVVIFLLMMATAFMGYVLPWGQMSFWGAKVITGLFGAIPVVGEPMQTWLLGGFAPDQRRAQPLLLAALSAAVRDCGCYHPAHLGAAHSGFVEPDRRRSEGAESDTVPFHPYYTAKDGFGARPVPYPVLQSLVFFAPNLLGHPDNYIPANPLSTPAHIVPEWYFWPFYAILRAFTVDFFIHSRQS
jgi:ubiquinol-cytochrome c reductase cytochrome b subunit